jgi:CheY-like chemotaxis protein
VSAAARARTALVVDDDDGVADTLTSMLSRDGLVVARAATGTEALAVLHDSTFDVVFLDLRLPDLSGEEVYAWLAAERPDVARRVIFVTGGLWRPEGGALRNRLPPQPTLGKPCTLAQIRDALRRLEERIAVA